MEKIFLSYATEDYEKVRKLYDDLKTRGFEPWMAPHSVETVANWEDVVNEELNGSGLFIACLSKKFINCLSPRSARRRYVKDELDTALGIQARTEGKAFLMPVRLDDCKIPDSLQRLHCFGYTEEGRSALIAAIFRHFGLEDFSQLIPLAIGVDVGTTKITAGLVSLLDPTNPKILVRRRINHADIGEEHEILDKIQKAITELVNEARVRLSDIERVGIGLPGQVDYQSGQLRFAPGLRANNIDVGTSLRQRLKVPVYCDNDVNCSTLAELRFGHGANYKNFVCVFVGTGIGAGVVIGGRLYRGTTFSAGEIGHMKIDCTDRARSCTCGGKGCLEEYASARAIVRMAREKIAEVKKRGQKRGIGALNPRTVKPEDIVTLVRRGDRVSVALAKRIAVNLALGIANITNLLNQKAVVLGGGIMDGFWGLDVFNTAFTEAFEKNVLHVCLNTRILRTSLGNDAPILGAAALDGK